MSLLKEHNLIFLLPADRYETEQMLGETFRSRGSGPEGLNLSPRILHPPTPPLWYSRHRTTGPAPFQNGMASSVDDPKFPASGGSCTPPRRSPPDRRQMLFSEAATCSWTPYFHDAYALHLGRPTSPAGGSGEARMIFAPLGISHFAPKPLRTFFSWSSRHRKTWHWPSPIPTQPAATRTRSLT